MTTKKIISIPGIKDSLVEEVGNIRDYEAGKLDRENKAKEALKLKRITESKEAFLEYLNKWVGTILRQLDFSTWTPVIENPMSNWSYAFRVAHTVITLEAPESLHGGNCTVSVSVKGRYSGDPEKKWIDNVKLYHYLSILICQIVEEYQQYRYLVAEIDQYNFCLRIAAQKTENDIASDKLSLWTWPDHATLDLYKITWTKGGYYDSDDEQVYLQYEHGWSLSDRPDERGYFDLLTPANSVNPRKLKVVPNSVELFSITSIEDVPAELMTDIYSRYDIAIASEVWIQQLKGDEEQVLGYKRELEELEGEDYIHMVFPEYLPEYPPGGNSHLVVYKTKSILLGRSPCLRIRLAAEAIAPLENN